MREPEPIIISSDSEEVEQEKVAKKKSKPRKKRAAKQAGQQTVRPALGGMDVNAKGGVLAPLDKVCTFGVL